MRNFRAETIKFVWLPGLVADCGRAGVVMKGAESHQRLEKSLYFGSHGFVQFESRVRFRGRYFFKRNISTFVGTVGKTTVLQELLETML